MISSINQAESLKSKQEERLERKLANNSKSLTAIKAEDDPSFLNKPKNGDLNPY